jgi:hypothetical protein
MRTPALARELHARLLILALCALLPGCAQLAPWERGILAKPHMAPVQLRQALDENVNTSREASAGGRSTARGGGCGCN